MWPKFTKQVEQCSQFRIQVFVNRCTDSDDHMFRSFDLTWVAGKRQAVFLQRLFEKRLRPILYERHRAFADVVHRRGV
jgi:hypothetical protein